MRRKLCIIAASFYVLHTSGAGRNGYSEMSRAGCSGEEHLPEMGAVGLGYSFLNSVRLSVK